LGKIESLEEIKGSYPVYTRPEKFILIKKIKKLFGKYLKLFFLVIIKKLKNGGNQRFNC
jgi:hypothetical protein